MDPEDVVNSRLIEAVEAGSLDRVRRALRDGADAGSRKRVTLEVRVRGETAMRSETTAAESALALAIRCGREQIVKELLDAGCDPNEPIIFKPAEYHPDGWSRSRWDNDRWGAELVFPFALDYACFGASLPGSPKGAHVYIVSPTKVEDVSVMAPADWKPNRGVIAALLDHNGKLSTSALALMVASSDNRTELSNSVGNLLGSTLIRRANVPTQTTRSSSRQSTRSVASRATSRQSSHPAPLSPYLASPDTRTRPDFALFNNPALNPDVVTADLRRQLREMTNRNASLEQVNHDLSEQVHDLTRELDSARPRSIVRSASRASTSFNPRSHSRQYGHTASSSVDSYGMMQSAGELADLRRQNRDLSVKVANLEEHTIGLEQQLIEERSSTLSRSRSLSRQSNRAPSSYSTRVASTKMSSGPVSATTMDVSSISHPIPLYSDPPELRRANEMLQQRVQSLEQLNAALQGQLRDEKTLSDVIAQASEEALKAEKEKARAARKEIDELRKKLEEQSLELKSLRRKADILAAQCARMQEERVGRPLQRQNSRSRHTLGDSSGSGDGSGIAMSSSSRRRPSAPPGGSSHSPMPLSGKSSAGSSSFAAFFQRQLYVHHAYTPTSADELLLRIGEKVACEQEFPDGWALGQNVASGQRGFFPLACTSSQPPIAGQPNIVASGIPLTPVANAGGPSGGNAPAIAKRTDSIQLFPKPQVNGSEPKKREVIPGDYSRSSRKSMDASRSGYVPAAAELRSIARAPAGWSNEGDARPDSRGSTSGWRDVKGPPTRILK